MADKAPQPKSILPLPFSSRARYRAYLAQRREERRAAKEKKGKNNTNANVKEEAAGGAGGASSSSSTSSPSSSPSSSSSSVPTSASSAFSSSSKDKHQRHRSIRVLFAEFLKLMRGHQWKVYTAIGTVVVATAIGLLMPLGAKFTLDYCVAPTVEHLEQLRAWTFGGGSWADRRVELAWWIGLASVAVMGLSIVVQLIGRYQLTRLNKIVQSRVRRMVFGQMSLLPLHRISALKSGGVASILREDAGGVGDALFIVLYNPIRGVGMLVGGLAMMAILDWRLSAMGLLLLPAVWYTHRTWIRDLRPVYNAIKAQRTTTDAHAAEAFAGVRIVRAFDRRRGEAGRFARNTHLMARQEMLVWWWSRGIELLWMLIMPLATSAALAYGTWRVLDAKLTIGDLGAFLTYLGMILGPMELLVGTASQLQGTLAAWDRCLDVMEEKTELEAGRQESDRHVLKKEDVRGEIELIGVGFSYPGSDKAVLSDVSLKAPAGSMVALVGASGSGKTTLCNLVARFFDPTVGRVMLDGTDLRRIDVSSYRRVLGVVEQEVFLFDGTIAENIAYADRHAGMDRIAAAARAANAHEFIDELEQKYDTVIGERGVRLSGGQKQRIAIARALLADPRVLILDEATSNLDTQSERLIQSSLATLMRGRTSFVIAHRLSTIRDADMIVVLEKGRVVETGTHEELVAKRGNYFEMLAVQLHSAKDYAA